MRTGLSQHTSLRQDLRINPRLYQAMDMLYMPMIDLQQHLKQELLINPFLELLEPEEDEGQDQATQEKQDKEETKKDDETDWEEILLNGFEVGGMREQYEEKEYIEPVTVETRDLQDHLREQLNMLELTPRQLLLAEEFLGNIKEDGYLAASPEEIIGSVNELMRGYTAKSIDAEPELDEFGNEVEVEPPETPVETPNFYSMAEIEEMLAIIQRLDPAGVGARDLRECLLLQLREKSDTDPLTFRLVDEAFPDLIAHRWNDLAKRFGVEPQAVQAAADELAPLDPQPGLQHASASGGQL